LSAIEHTSEVTVHHGTEMTVQDAVAATPKYSVEEIMDSWGRGVPHATLASFVEQRLEPVKNNAIWAFNLLEEKVEVERVVNGKSTKVSTAQRLFTDPKYEQAMQDIGDRTPVVPTDALLVAAGAVLQSLKHAAENRQIQLDIQNVVKSRLELEECVFVGIDGARIELRYKDRTQRINSGLGQEILQAFFTQPRGTTQLHMKLTERQQKSLRSAIKESEKKLGIDKLFAYNDRLNSLHISVPLIFGV